MNPIRSRFLSIAAVVLACGSAHAAFTDLGNGAVYDSTRDITLIQDVRYYEVDLAPTARLTGLWGVSVSNAGGEDHVVTSADIFQVNYPPLRVGGTWWGAMAWANTLTFAGVGGWRLPSATELVAVVTDPSYSGTFTHTSFGPNSYLMWTSSEIDASTAIDIQTVPASNPSFYQASHAKVTDLSGTGIMVLWAVHQGNINAVPSVPEPSTSLLYLLGLATVLSAATRIAAKGR